LVSQRRKIAQVGHQAKVFHVETATFVVGDYPDRGHAFPVEVKGDQQALVDKGRDPGQVGEMALRMRK
jgi:hypothetical protein